MAILAMSLGPRRIVFRCSAEYDGGSDVFSSSIYLSSTKRDSLRSAVKGAEILGHVAEGKCTRRA